LKSHIFPLVNMVAATTRFDLLIPANVWAQRPWASLEQRERL